MSTYTDEKRRNNISEKQLESEREKHMLSNLGGRDKKIKCPECKKFAFYYHPGTVLLQRQPCGRYDARTDKEQCLAGNGPRDEEPWG